MIEFPALSEAAALTKKAINASIDQKWSACQSTEKFGLSLLSRSDYL
jgi:hypothetical protein